MFFFPIFQTYSLLEDSLVQTSHKSLDFLWHHEQELSDKKMPYIKYQELRHYTYLLQLITNTTKNLH